MPGAQLVTFGPAAKKAKNYVGFRCPPEDRAWLESVGELSTSLRWAVTKAREYHDAVKPFYRRLEELAKADGYTMSGLVGRVLRTGLDVYEAERKQKK